MSLTSQRHRADAHRRTAAAAHGVPLEFEGLRAALSALYGQTANSRHVFGSPLGPVRHGSQSYWLPRFVYFGPHFSDASVRLAIYAGFDGSDVRPTRGVLQLVERLILKPDLGEGLNLTFFPLVNPSGLEAGSRTSQGGADLAGAHWNLSAEPEIELLANDARLRGYHGFLRVEAGDVAAITASIRSGSRAARVDDAVLVPPARQGEPFPVRWTSLGRRELPMTGPLSIADDLVDGPFEILLQIPGKWEEALFAEAIAHVLRRFVTHFRASYAYGMNL